METLESRVKFRIDESMRAAWRSQCWRLLLESFIRDHNLVLQRQELYDH